MKVGTKSHNRSLDFAEFHLIVPEDWKSAYVISDYQPASD